MSDNCNCGVQACTLPDPDKQGNAYFKGNWDYCTEYKVGDMVLYGGLVYLALIPHAGKEPKSNKELWAALSGMLEPPPPPGRIVLDGGFATTKPDEVYKVEIDGGASNGRIFQPLI